jgi:hypothetical protein
MNFRDLTKDDIEVRVQSVKKNGLVLLLYKNARVDMNILDETVGAENWQREHYEVKGNMFCRVGIKVGKISVPSALMHSELDASSFSLPEWVWKADCGTESNTEAQKGEASDSFKRACFNWGIGRELYTSPFIWVKADKCKIEDNKCYDTFSVEKIKIENKRIVGLAIRNDRIYRETGDAKAARAFVYTEEKADAQ